MTSFDHRKGDNNDQSRQECCAFTGAFFSSHGSDAHKRELEAQAGGRICTQPTPINSAKL